MIGNLKSMPPAKCPDCGAEFKRKAWNHARCSACSDRRTSSRHNEQEQARRPVRQAEARKAMARVVVESHKRTIRPIEMTPEPINVLAASRWIEEAMR